MDEGGMPVIRAIMNLGRNMGLTTVAEGVENEHQNRALRAEGCDLIQGFHFFRPMSAEALLAHLRQPVAALAS
jgi:EAL domain-containing protein (putative c-di-GMP-specific phosphodiesterase class I)